MQVSKSELDDRCERFQKLLRQRGIDAALIVQNADLYYFSGIVHRAYLYIPAEGPPVLLGGRGSERIAEESCLDRVASLTQLRDLPSVLQGWGYPFPTILGLESDVLPASLYARYTEIFAPAAIVDVSALIREVRMIKSAWELDKIRAACHMGGQIFDFVSETLEEGIGEYELLGRIEHRSRQLGHPGFMRARAFNQELTYVLVLSGSDAVIPSYGSGPLGGRGASFAFPHSASGRKIARNEAIIVDYCPWVDGYMADMTRTFCIGTLPAHMSYAYETALEINDMLIKEARPGALCSELWGKARKIVRNHGFCEHFMGMAHRVSFIAHGVGLEVDEWPVLAAGVDMVLQSGMVIAAEPKFVFPDGAVGLENTFVVGPNGLEKLGDTDDSLRSVAKWN
jgi:Xaa-Pro aminopeptidase